MEFPKRLIGVVLDPGRQRSGYPPYVRYHVPGCVRRWQSADNSSDGLRESDRMPGSQRRKQYRSVMYSGFRIFCGNSRESRNKNLSKISFPFLYSFLKDPSLTRQGFFFILIKNTHNILLSDADKYHIWYLLTLS